MKFINSEGQRILGLDTPSLGCSLRELPMEPLLSDHLAFSIASERLRFVELTLGGSMILTCSSFRLQSQDQRDTVCLLTDITDFRQLERYLEQSDRLSSLSRLSGGLSREIGLPITDLKRHMIELETHWGDEQRMATLIQSISSHVDHINSLCQSLLRLGKPSVVQCRPINLYSLFYEVKGLVKGDLDLTQVDIQESIDRSIYIKGDYHQLLQVMC